MIVAANVRPAQASDWPLVRALLSAADLPTLDLDETSIADFIVAVNAGQVVGAVAVERLGAYGLLRSLVVDRHRRGAGLGQSLVSAAESAARDAGLSSLTLLTQTAAPFFGALGYLEIQRIQAPLIVRGSAEFTQLCPVNCTCMFKSLDMARDS